VSGVVGGHCERQAIRTHLEAWDRLSQFSALIAPRARYGLLRGTQPLDLVETRTAHFSPTGVGGNERKRAAAQRRRERRGGQIIGGIETDATVKVAMKRRELRREYLLERHFHTREFPDRAQMVPARRQTAECLALRLGGDDD
jgi:hypothetical protein